MLFDSEGKAVGQDFSRWNDVYLTLQGKYGARSTRADAADDASAVMHVAAPIRDGERIIGVLTVAKPISTVQPFVRRSQRKILQRGALLLVLSLLIGIGFAWWLTRALGKLTAYASSVEAGGKAPLPALGNNEIGVLGRALEAMRARLDGKEYVEELMHTLAHELKSPIAAIQGSAELMREPMPPEQRAHFLDNILNQNARQKQLIDRLLALIQVEQQQQLAAPAPIDVPALLAQVAADCEARLAARSLVLRIDAADLPPLRGDALLLRQAIGNLLDNAIDFSPAGSAISLQAARQVDELVDHGARQRRRHSRVRARAPVRALLFAAAARRRAQHRAWPAVRARGGRPARRQRGGCQRAVRRRLRHAAAGAVLTPVSAALHTQRIIPAHGASYTGRYPTRGTRHAKNAAVQDARHRRPDDRDRYPAVDDPVRHP